MFHTDTALGGATQEAGATSKPGRKVLSLEEVGPH